MCPLGNEPTTFALPTQCSTTEPQEHASTHLTSHENSPEHLNCMKAWKELAVRLRSGETIDKQQVALLEAERVRWRAVLTRLTAIVQSLAVLNLALRGHTETLFTPSNGNFLPHIREHFMGFLEAEESTGQHLASMILTRLEELEIPFEDCRGQSYDNGANMKGKNKGVQARLLEKNPHALFVPCGVHTLTLVVCDAAKGSVDAMSYFGVLQKLYMLFSASSQRWAILKNHVSITLKMWAETMWESKVKSIEPMRYQGAAVREALIEVRDNTKYPAIKAEAQSFF